MSQVNRAYVHLSWEKKVEKRKGRLKIESKYLNFLENLKEISLNF